MASSASLPASHDRLLIFDTTLRDGEQSPGVHLTGEDKVKIGQQLARLGVDVCEIGFPACAVDLPSIQQIVLNVGSFTEGRASGEPMILAVLARCVKSDIDAAWSVVSSAARPRIHVFLATSDIHLEWKLKKTQAEALAIITDCVSYARSKCADVEFSAEDASRTGLPYLTQAFITAVNAGATTLNIPDTVGTSVPHEFGPFVAAVIAGVKAALPLSIFNTLIFATHCHNDLGLAVANTMAAVRAGARQAECTINGIGERAGNAAGEEIIMNVELQPFKWIEQQPQQQQQQLHHNFNIRLLVPTSQLVSSLSGMAVQRNKAIVGVNSCLHESGVHVDGIVKNRSTYEIFAAASVGWPEAHSGIVLGKHSGRAAYKAKMKEIGVTFAADNNSSNTKEFHLEPSFVLFQALAIAGKDQNYTTAQLKATAVNSNSSSSSRPLKSSFNTPLLTSVLPAVLDLVELRGDGINDEVTAEGRKILDTVISGMQPHFSGVARAIRWSRHSIGGRAIDETNGATALPASTLAACQQSHGVLLGAVGTPKYGPDAAVRPEQGLLALRTAMEVFANLRPVQVYPQLMAAAPFKPEVIAGVDLMIVRELTGGIYMASHTQTATDATDVMYYTVSEIERIIRVAADLVITRNRSTVLLSLDKANVLACSRLWRTTATRVIATEYPSLTIEHQLIDSAAMLMMQHPTRFDVVVTENLFGDILSDECASLAASLGMMGSASIGLAGKPGLFEPVHGSAPTIAGKNIANPIGTVLAAAMLLRYGLKMTAEAEAVEQAIRDVIADGVATIDIAAAGVTPVSTTAMGDAINARVKVLIAAIPRDATATAAAAAVAAATATNTLTPSTAVQRRRPMTLPEKILCHQAIGLSSASVSVGDVLVVRVARTLASEMTWLGMNETWQHIGKPAIWRNDRFFLAVDHTVDPTNYEKPFQHALITAAATFAADVKLVDYFGPNTSILHTEFYRQRAVPGTVIVGADSHSCSAGCLGAFAAGMGAADVVMPVVTGQTFIQVPETLLIHFTHDLAFGMSGKDVMLYLLQQLKRNTVAFERCVEFSGNIASLSVDSRFAISNMATEFGAIAGIFPSDEITAAFLAGRHINAKAVKAAAAAAAAAKANPNATVTVVEEELELCASEAAAVDEDAGGEAVALNFQRDADAVYADRYDIDLSLVTPLIAKWPSPDNVFAIDHPEIDAVVAEIGRSIRVLDGCFIGACTTTEEELILAALVLEAGLTAGLTVSSSGSRKVSPGSAIMKAKLERVGVLDIYRRCGYVIGAPGCAYCLAVNGVDVAVRGSVWLSSQNRNFKNRMGPGSIGNLASAATVAASSFSMTITDPRALLAMVDPQRFAALLERQPVPLSVPRHEPNPELSTESTDAAVAPAAVTASVAVAAAAPVVDFLPFVGRCQVFGDHVDTDAIIPGQLMLERPLSKLASHSFAYVRPEFVGRVAAGRTVVVAGVGFGSGSSREEAVSCLRAVGIKAVIARSFAFIFGRNLLCLDLLGVLITDDRFYELAVEDSEVSVDVNAGVVSVAGVDFPFTLSPIQKQIYRGGGVVEMYRKQGKGVFKKLAEHAKQRQQQKTSETAATGAGACGTNNKQSNDVEMDLPVTSNAQKPTSAKPTAW